MLIGVKKKTLKSECNWMILVMFEEIGHTLNYAEPYINIGFVLALFKWAIIDNSRFCGHSVYMEMS